MKGGNFMNASSSLFILAKNENKELKEKKTYFSLSKLSSICENNQNNINICEEELDIIRSQEIIQKFLNQECESPLSIQEIINMGLKKNSEKNDEKLIEILLSLFDKSFKQQSSSLKVEIYKKCWEYSLNYFNENVFDKENNFMVQNNNISSLSFSDKKLREITRDSLFFRILTQYFNTNSVLSENDFKNLLKSLDYEKNLSSKNNQIALLKFIWEDFIDISNEVY
jgi:hypothetical protein